MQCGICGRTLKGAISLERGYGPVCYQKIKPSSIYRRVPKKNMSAGAVNDMDENVPGQINLSEFINT